MWSSGKKILHYDTYSESSWGLIRNNGSDGIWMVTKPAGRGHEESVWQQQWLSQDRLQREKQLSDKNCTHWTISGIKTIGYLALGILIFWKGNVGLVYSCPPPTVETPNFPFPALSDGLKELTGQCKTFSFNHIHVNPWCSKKKKKRRKNPVV